MELQQVILVNERDEPVGLMDKLEAHQKGLLHRAFSVFIFNSRGELLLQRRALHKYHSGGLWTNTCCSHPQPGEVLADAAQRRLREEMGFGTPLKEIFEFVYEAEFDNGLSEHEFDHVFAGVYDGKIEYNKDEVMDYCYRSVEEVTTELEQKPEQFSAWFRVAFPRIKEWQRDLKVKR